MGWPSTAVASVFSSFLISSGDNFGRSTLSVSLLSLAVSGNGGWQEGAVAAAWKQAKQLHETAMTTKATPSKQTSGA